MEDASITVCFLLESVAMVYGAEPEPYTARTNGFDATGKIRSGWRRREREDNRWALQREEWIVTRGPLPNNAQALIAPNRSSQRAAAGSVAPVFQTKRTAS